MLHYLCMVAKEKAFLSDLLLLLQIIQTHIKYL